ncbi:MAG: tetratricopeptide repeat protein [Lacunisphaera sp.]|nr:tetratricopeptide repeat protein [Lacunisphaera sp.]
MSAASQPTLPPSRRSLLFAALGLLFATLVAYHNSFGVPFVFDDVPAIVDNASLRHLWPPGGVLEPRLEDAGVTVSGRPLVNLSLAFNYALGGETVWGYHVVNLLIHLLAGLTLFGVMRRTLLRPVLRERFGAVAFPVALAVAVIWLLHPLQTETVTYVVQRAESLMGLCYLLTLYGFIRATEAAPSGRWLGLSFAACLAGMACKEVMVSAPLMIFLYDRTFLAGSFRDAWRRHRWYYAGLAATWLLLAWLVAGTAGRGGTAGFGTEVSPWSYALTQCGAIVHYLWLAVWPHPLVFDYGTAVVGSVGEVWPQALLLGGLGVGTVVALWRWPVWGFIGAWFFGILAPSSSFVPVASQTMAEHRMYLALVVVVVVAVCGLYVWLGRRAGAVCAVLALIWTGLTIQRNEDYRSDVALWTDTVAKRPANARAHNNLGKAVLAAGGVADAAAHFERAIQLQPTVPEPHYNRGLALAQLGRRAEAIGEYETALRLQPRYADAHNNLGNALLLESRLPDALAHYEQAVALRPGFAEAQSNLANALLETGRGPEALTHANEAVRLDPAYAEARYNLGNVLAQAGDLPAALTEYEAALRLKPDYADVANNLGNVLVGLERLPEAIARYELALRLQPDFADPRRNLAQVLAHLGRLDEARAHYEILLRLHPDDQPARAELDRLRAAGRP